MPYEYCTYFLYLSDSSNPSKIFSFFIIEVIFIIMLISYGTKNNIAAFVNAVNGVTLVPNIVAIGDNPAKTISANASAHPKLNP